MSTFSFYLQNFFLKDDCTIIMFFFFFQNWSRLNYLSYVDLGNIVPFKTEVLIGMTRQNTDAFRTPELKVEAFLSSRELEQQF